MKIDDAVRLKSGSSLADLLGPAANAIGRISHAERDDTTDARRIAGAYAELETYTSLLPAAEFDLVGTSALAVPTVRENTPPFAPE